MNLKIYLRGLGVGIIVTALVLGFSDKNHAMTDAQIKARAAELGMVEQNSNTVLSDLQAPASDAETEDGSKAEDESDKNTSSAGETASASPVTTPVTSSQEEDVSDDTEDVRNEADTSSANTEPGSSKTDEDAEPSGTDEDIEPEETDEPAAQETDAAQKNTLDDEDANSTLGGNKNTNSTATNANNSTTNTNNTTANNNTTNNSTTNSNSGKTVRITVNAGDTSWPVARRVATAGLVEDASEFDDYLCDNGYAGYLRAGVYEIPVGATQEQIAKILAQR